MCVQEFCSLTTFFPLLLGVGEGTETSSILIDAPPLNVSNLLAQWFITWFISESPEGIKNFLQVSQSSTTLCLLLETSQG